MKNNIAIIILNYINYRLTIECVNSLRTQGVSFDIIIVDNDSPNESFTELEKTFYESANTVVLRTGKNGGYSYGNNWGINWATSKNYDYYCIMNPDIIIKDKNIFSKLIDVFSFDDSIAVVSGIQIYAQKAFGQFINSWELPGKISGIFDHSFVDFFWRKTSTVNVDPSCRYAEVDVLSGCFFIIRSDVMHKIGGFDENVFLFYEENILASKIKKLGYKEALYLDEYFCHNHITGNTNIKKRIKEKRIQVKSRSYFYKTYVTNNIMLHFVQDIFTACDFIISSTVYIGYGVIECLFQRLR